MIPGSMIFFFFIFKSLEIKLLDSALRYVRNKLIRYPDWLTGPCTPPLARFVRSWISFWIQRQHHHNLHYHHFILILTLLCLIITKSKCHQPTRSPDKRPPRQFQRDVWQDRDSSSPDPSDERDSENADGQVMMVMPAVKKSTCKERMSSRLVADVIESVDSSSKWWLDLSMKVPKVLKNHYAPFWSLHWSVKNGQFSLKLSVLRWTDQRTTKTKNEIGKAVSHG